VVPEIEAAMPCSTAARARSGHCQRGQRLGLVGFRREFAGQRLDGDHDLRGKNWGPSSPGQIDQAGQAMVEEAFAPLGNDLARRVQAGGDLVVAQAVGRVEHDLGAHNFGTR